MAEDLDLDAASAYLISSGGKDALVEALSIGIKPEVLTASGGKVLSFIAQHHADSGVVPSAEDIRGLFGEKAVQTTSLSRQYVFGEVMRRALFRKVADGVGAVEKLLHSNNPEGAYGALLKVAEAAGDVTPKWVKPTSLFSLGQNVKDEYELVASGKIGLPTPWASINNMTMGLWPGTNTWFLARPGTGKTWIEVVIADYIWSLRNQDPPREVNTLIVSPEMSKAQLAERFFVLDSGMSYGAVVGGTLGEFQKAKFYKAIDKNAQSTGVWILDATDDLTPSRIEDAVEKVNADILIIDAVYKLKWGGKDRFDNMYRGVDQVSTWAKKSWDGDRKIAVLATSQMNRGGVAKGGGFDQGSVALSDNLSWEADNLFFMEQTEDMKADKQLVLHTSKVRRMASYQPKITMRWDMETMTFSEIIPVVKPKKSFHDDEYDDENY